MLTKYKNTHYFIDFDFLLKPRKPLISGQKNRANEGNRTPDLRITSASLYRLSHSSLPFYYIKIFIFVQCYLSIFIMNHFHAANQVFNIQFCSVIQDRPTRKPAENLMLIG